MHFDLCFVTTCMGRLAALQQTLRPMLAQGGSCVVVDYSCPERAGDWVAAAYPMARLVRVPGHDQFHAARARNLGARHADASWLCFVDADVVLAAGFAEAVFPMLAAGGYYRAILTDRGLGGTFLCSRDDFERVGGYDEMYCCWGEEDNDLYDALSFIGLESRALPERLVNHLAHDDEARTRYYPVADRVLGHAVNRVYRILKWDVARLRRELLDGDARRALYEKVSEVVTASIQSGKPGELSVRLPDGLVPGDRLLSRQLVYRLQVGQA